MKQLGIKQYHSSAYHPESQGALERFHQTLKTMLRSYCLENGKDWDEGVHMLLFAVRETVQESLGFDPFDLVFGHSVRGPLSLLKDAWMSSTPPINLLKYVSTFRERLLNARQCAMSSLVSSQKRMKSHYDEGSSPRSFVPGEKVLVLFPVPGSPLKAKFSGPYEIIKKINDVDYVIRTPDRRRDSQVCHINMLKKYH